MQDRLDNGLVVRVTGGEVWVQIELEVVRCVLRGRFRVKQSELQIVAGDRVQVRRGTGAEAGDAPALEVVEPRTSWLSRHTERGRGERMIVSNIERLFVVAAIAEPPLRPTFVDRVLASAEQGHIPASLIINKSDLDPGGEAARIATIYQNAGYDVVTTCAETGRGIPKLESKLGNGIYAFVGESGVGKSSIVNRLDPDLDLPTQEIGERTGRGRHTTTNSQLFPFRTGYLADTPGMQTFGFPSDDEAEIAAYFPEIARIDTRCRFEPCTHSHEPGCLVKAAVESGAMAASRYESYLSILAEVRERAKNKSW